MSTTSTITAVLALTCAHLAWGQCEISPTVEARTTTAEALAIRNALFQKLCRDSGGALLDGDDKLVHARLVWPFLMRPQNIASIGPPANGSAVVAYIISPDGVVKWADVLEYSGHKDFKSFALAAYRNANFDPPTLDGQPVPVFMTAKFSYGPAPAQAPRDVELFRKLSVKAEAGSVPAQYNLGMLYNNGIGTTKDPQRALEWFEKSAISGDALASYKVGCYYDGQFPGVVPVDFEKALQSKLVSARAGYSLAQHDVGVAYFLKKDYGEAVKWLSAAAEQGEPNSLVSLSEAYRTGNGVSVNPEKSLELLLITSRLVSADKWRQFSPQLRP